MGVIVAALLMDSVSAGEVVFSVVNISSGGHVSRCIVCIGADLIIRSGPHSKAAFLCAPQIPTSAAYVEEISPCVI